MKAETLFERPRIEGSGDALKHSLRSFGAKARDAGLSSLGFNKARGRLSIRHITDKLFKDFMAYVGGNDIHPVTDDTVRDYISRYYGQQLPAVEPTIQQMAGGGPPQQGNQPPPDETEFDQYTQGTGASDRRQGGDRRQPPLNGQQPPPANTQGPPGVPPPAPAPTNIASTRQSTPEEMARYQKLLALVNRSVMNPTPDPQFMNRITALLKSASGSNNLRQYAKQKIDELKARPDVTQRYPEIANIGDDPFANLPRAAAPAAPPAQPTTPVAAAPNPAAPPAQAGAGIHAAFVGAAKAMGENLRDMLWRKVQAGDVTEGGAPSRILQAAKAAMDNGTLKSRADFDQFYTDYGNSLKQGTTAAQPNAQPTAPPNPAQAAAANSGWRQTRPGEVFPPGGRYRMNQTTGQPEVYEPEQAASAAAPDTTFDQHTQGTGATAASTTAQPGETVQQSVSQIGPILSKPTITPQEHWWVMAAVNNALQKTQRGTPQRQQVVAALRALQNNPQAVAKIPQLKQIPLESHQRVFDLAMFLVENQITDKTALHEAYCRIMLEATALNRGQIDQIFKVLARNLNAAGMAYTQRGGKGGNQQTAQGHSKQGWGSSNMDPQRMMTTTITPQALQSAKKYVNINPHDYQLLVQAAGQNGEKLQQILRSLKNKTSHEMVELLIHAAGESVTAFAFLIDLCESHLIPSQTSLKRWDDKKLAELAYLYFLGLRVLLGNASSKQWARDYCKKAGEPNDFATWRSNGNDLYVMLYGLSDDADGKKPTINPGVLRHWFRHVASDDKEDMHRLFVRLDAMFHITNSAMRAMRRIVMDWPDADDREQKDVLTKLIQMIHSRAPSNSELLPHLKSLPLDESASAGATGAASVAAVVGGLGAGFDDDHSKSIYGPKKEPVVIRRNP